MTLTAVPNAATEGRVETALLKDDARANYAPGHPYRLAVETLADTVTSSEFIAQLRILLPLARIREA